MCLGEEEGQSYCKLGICFNSSLPASEQVLHTVFFLVVARFQKARFLVGAQARWATHRSMVVPGPTLGAYRHVSTSETQAAVSGAAPGKYLDGTGTISPSALPPRL